MALAALSMLATVAIPSYFGRADVTLQNAAKLLVEDVGVARRLAIGSGKAVELHLATDGYFVTSKRGELFRHPRTGSAFRRNYDRDAVFRDVRIYRIAQVEDRVVRFSPTGTSEGAEAIHMMFRGRRMAVQLDHETSDPTIIADN